MFKSILYYILMIAEFCSTMFVGGIVMGIYLAFSGKLEEGNAHDQASFLKEGAPIFYVFCILTILILWFTFSKAKFSKFTLGRVNPTYKWKAMFWYTTPLLGTTMTFIALFNFFGYRYIQQGHHAFWIYRATSDDSYRLFYLFLYYLRCDIRRTNQMRQEDMGFLPCRSCIQYHTIHRHNPGAIIDVDNDDDDMEHRADITPLLYLQNHKEHHRSICGLHHL